MRWCRDADATKVGETTQAYQAAVDIAEDLIDGRGIDIARSWGDWAAAREAWHEAAGAYDAALRLQQLLVAREPSRAYAQQRLSIDTTSARAAALAYFHAGDADRAALAIDGARAQLMSASLLRMWTDVEALRVSGDAALAARYEAARAKLDALDRAQAFDDDIVLTEWNARHKEARAEFEAAVAEIRARPGQSAFLRPSASTELRRAAVAAGVPLVYLVPGPQEGCALIVGKDGARGVRLDELLAEDVRSHAVALLTAGDHHAQSAAVQAAGEWMWTAIAEPLLADLGGERDIVVVAAGLLSMLPVHAAQTPDPDTVTGRRYLIDDVGVRYAPNARTLLTPARTGTEGVVLAVADPQPTSHEQLAGAAAELALVVASDPGHTIALEGTDATRAAVLRRLPDVDRLHVACHAVADVVDPLRSGLILAHDERLTLRDLLATRLELDLAVLSACETAVPGGQLPDEVMSLPSALLQAGARTVVATQWRVADLATLLLVALFTRERQAETSVGDALRNAQRTLRDSTNAQLVASVSDDRALRGARRVLQLADPSARDYADPALWAAFVVVGR